MLKAIEERFCSYASAARKQSIPYPRWSEQQETAVAAVSRAVVAAFIGFANAVALFSVGADRLTNRTLAAP